jgi:hypothetical protein
MGLCKDPRLTYLNEEGYNVVRLPRKGITPLGVIGRDHKSKTWLGTLVQIWHSDLPAPPKPGDPQITASITGKATSDIKLRFGLKVLAKHHQPHLWRHGPSIDAYESVKSVQFVFREVQSVGIDPYAIGNFLAKGDLAGANPIVKKFFGGHGDLRREHNGISHDTEQHAQISPMTATATSVPRPAETSRRPC